MVKIKPSMCTCGKCGTQFTVEWDLDLVDVIPERGMGEEYQYEDRECIECPSCGNHIEVWLTASEYPVGALENAEAVIIHDEAGHSTIDTPAIYFFDL